MATHLTRRSFLSGSAAALAATTLGQDQDQKTVPPSERITVGLIGCGGQGSFHLGRLVGNPEVAVLGVSDVFQPRLDRAAQSGKCKAYRDWRELIARPDLDAVWIATPDHWHAPMAIAAMEAGKDVYLEKPMAHHWQGARDIHRTSVRTGRVLQVGSQHCSRASFWKAGELIRAGRLGRLVWSQTSLSRNLKEGDWNWPVDYGAGAHNLDWAAFLGEAPRRPFDAERFFRWRKYWDYSGGIATDLYSHALYSLSVALGAEFPARVVAGGGVVVHRDRETPDTFHTVIDDPTGHSLVIAGSQANEQGLPVMVRGHEATMYLSSSSGEIVIRPERIFGGQEEKLNVPEAADTFVLHHQDFLDCVRRRDPNTRCNRDLAYRVTTAIDLAVESYRRNVVCRFDPERETVLG